MSMIMIKRVERKPAATKYLLLAGLALNFGAVEEVRSDEVGRFPPLSSLFPNEWALATTVNSTTQTSNVSSVNSEVLASFDFIGSIPSYGGQLNFYVEGSTTPSEHGVVATFASANADAGTAIDSKGQGRIQISELNFVRHLNTEQVIAVGLIDPAAYLDTSEIANSEKTQFLNTQLKNNASIAMPSYTVSMAYHAEPNSSIPGYTVFIGSSHGLANNVNADYASLVDVTRPEKGLFSAVELYDQFARFTPRIGVWMNNGEQSSRSGIYANVDGTIASTGYNFRVGWTDIPNLPSRAAASFALLQRWSLLQLGTGVSYIRDGFSSTSADSWQAEIYARTHIYKELHVSPSLQYLSDSEIGGNRSGAAALIGSMRFTYEM